MCISGYMTFLVSHGLELPVTEDRDTLGQGVTRDAMQEITSGALAESTPQDRSNPTTIEEVLCSG